MPRRTISLAFVFLLLMACVTPLAFAPIGASAATATPTTETGQPASTSQVQAVTATLTVWASRIGRHDSRALDMMTPAAQGALYFGVTDRTLLKELLGYAFTTTINAIDDVRVQGDGTLTALVVYTGFNAKYAYQTTEFALRDKGGAYLTIVGAALQGTVFAKGDNVAKIDLTFETDGRVTLSPKSVARQDYLVIELINQTADDHYVLILKHGRDPLGAANLLAEGFVGLLEPAPIPTIGMPRGAYDVVESGASGETSVIGTFTIT